MNNDPNFCDICCRPKTPPTEYPNDSVCCCKGIQPYALSNYPGEFRLTASHPGNDSEQWYPRLKIDPLLTRLETVEQALRELVRLNDLKQRIERGDAGDLNQLAAMELEYDIAKPIAWGAAREAIKEENS